MRANWLIWVLGLAVLPLPAQAFEQKDWPCKQRKVDHLSPGQFWNSGELPTAVNWRLDPDLADVIPRLAARRTDAEQAAQLLDRLKAGPDKLGQVFAGVFAQVDQERYRLIQGITRYAKKQKALSDQIDQRRNEIEALKDTTADDDFDGLDKIEELEDALAWDTRIFQDRQQSLIYVCESPVLLERHVFAISRVLQERIPK